MSLSFSLDITYAHADITHTFICGLILLSSFHFRCFTYSGHFRPLSFDTCLSLYLSFAKLWYYLRGFSHGHSFHATTYSPHTPGLASYFPPWIPLLYIDCVNIGWLSHGYYISKYCHYFHYKFHYFPFDGLSRYISPSSFFIELEREEWRYKRLFIISARYQYFIFSTITLFTRRHFDIDMVARSHFLSFFILIFDLCFIWLRAAFRLHISYRPTAFTRATASRYRAGATRFTSAFAVGLMCTFGFSHLPDFMLHFLYWYSLFHFDFYSFLCFTTNTFMPKRAEILFAFLLWYLLVSRRLQHDEHILIHIFAVIRHKVASISRFMPIILASLPTSHFDASYVAILCASAHFLITISLLWYYYLCEERFRLSPPLWDDRESRDTAHSCYCTLLILCHFAFILSPSGRRSYCFYSYFDVY